MDNLLELKPTDKVLFLAEGNFTFSLSLVELWYHGLYFFSSTIDFRMKIVFVYGKRFQPGIILARNAVVYPLKSYKSECA